MFGKLTLDAVPYHEPIIMVTIAAIIIGGAALVGLITYFGKWSYLWNEWLTSVDHKKLGIMYCIVGIVMLIRGFADAIMMRSQQALASAGEAGFLPPHHYDQIFTAHGVIMIFFVAMPLVIGLMNVVVPLQIGARDVAFPFLNNLSFWFTVVGVILVNLSIRAAVKLLLLTMVRKSELTNATWSEINFSEALWTIPKPLKCHDSSSSSHSILKHLRLSGNDLI